MKRIVVISDTQLPYHDHTAVKNLIDFIGQWQPDGVIHIGDLMDYPTPSRWSKDTRAEFVGSVMKDSEMGKQFLGRIRRIFDGWFKVIPGNHDERPEVYLESYAPALAEYPFDLSTLLDFDSHGVEMARGFVDFAPGWTATHGHLGFSMSQVAGGTALRAAKKIGKSVVCGHTHRLGLVGDSCGYNGKVETRWGFEVGNLMDMASASYLRNGGANWQKGFGVFYTDGDNVTPVPVPVHDDGTFVVDGYVFGKRA
ncbi:metallophosphoesterase [Actinomadura rubrisoli]|uniref:Calcineurin-like phosphoesterase domain-containing protein n=1 Tax=Actinomadura rubrisoli TaxID=2530368 RepID=A0A4R5CB95_9ACTN|nr:metallophosphoesterase [Actinomadura rubrisoli]TDD97221.1 hypothetical protein E1298_01940 [Actinomadura rubrisoli]